MAISMLKIRRPLGRLIFNMGIAIPGKTVFLIETAPWRFYDKLVEPRIKLVELVTKDNCLESLEIRKYTTNLMFR